jgi:hypothetical protein
VSISIRLGCLHPGRSKRSSATADADWAAAFHKALESEGGRRCNAGDLRFLVSASPPPIMKSQARAFAMSLSSGPLGRSWFVSQAFLCLRMDGVDCGAGFPACIWSIAAECGAGFSACVAVRPGRLESLPHPPTNPDRRTARDRVPARPFARPVRVIPTGETKEGISIEHRNREESSIEHRSRESDATGCENSEPGQAQAGTSPRLRAERRAPRRVRAEDSQAGCRVDKRVKPRSRLTAARRTERSCAQ